jgi:RNA polymerase sigma factor FliA
MQIQMYEKHNPHGPMMEQLALEYLYQHLDQHLGRPAADAEICRGMNISLDEFHRILDQLKDLSLGSFENVANSENAGNDPQIRYIPDASRSDVSVVRCKSEFRKMLTHAIEKLPHLERMIASLYYDDELTLAEIERVLRISSADIAQLRTKTMLRLRSKLCSRETSEL